MAKEQAAPGPDVIAGWVIRGIGGVTNMLERMRPDAVEHWSEANVADLLREGQKLFWTIEAILSVHGVSLIHSPAEPDETDELG